MRSASYVYSPWRHTIKGNVTEVNSGLIMKSNEVFSGIRPVKWWGNNKKPRCTEQNHDALRMVL